MYCNEYICKWLFFMIGYQASRLSSLPIIIRDKKMAILSICLTYICHLNPLCHHYNIPEASVSFKEQNIFEHDLWYPLSNWCQDVLRHA